MTEYNLFCWSEKHNDKNSFQQKRYRVFNTEVTKEEYNSIFIPTHTLKFDKNEDCKTRYKTAFRNMWNKLTQTEKEKYYNIPHFNWEGFTFITGIEKDKIDKVKLTIEGKNIYISRESAKTLNLI